MTAQDPRNLKSQALVVEATAGIDVHVAWNNHSYISATGNSSAAPHIAGIAALIRSKHPELTLFQIKTVLFACASNTHGLKTSHSRKGHKKGIAAQSREPLRRTNNLTPPLVTTPIRCYNWHCIAAVGGSR